VKRLAGRFVGGVWVVVAATAAAWLLFRLLRPNLFADEPGSLVSQLWHYLERAFLHFDFGRSERGSQRPVSDLIREGVPADASLLFGGLIAGLLGGVGGGIVCARRPRGWLSRTLQGGALVGMGAPVYVVGLSLLLLFGQEIGTVPVLHVIPLHYVPFAESPVRWVGSLIVPWLVLGLPLAGMCLRVMLGEMVEVADLDYVRAARAKGLTERVILRRHVAPAALAPTAMLASASMPLLLANAVLVEQVFSIPGVFSDFAQAIGTANTTLILGATAVGAALIAITTFLFDLFLTWLDPRVRAREGAS
jgi:peptide/nickel transport system permease protein